MRETIQEYNGPHTWTPIREREMWSEAEAEQYQRELVRIAGLNPFGEPNLVIRWAVAYDDPMVPDGKPKYFYVSTEPVLIGSGYNEGNEFINCPIDDVPPHKICTPLYGSTHLGERRFIVERWRSAEFLAKSGRYQQTVDADDISTWYYCKNCGEGVPVQPGTENLDVQRTCRKCHSRRVSLREERQSGQGVLLNSLPERGCYDFFYRIEELGGTFHPPDGRSLEAVRQLWAQSQRTFAEKDAELRAGRKQAADRARAQRREAFRNTTPLTEEELYVAGY
jgi:hypothetical protein